MEDGKAISDMVEEVLGRLQVCNEVKDDGAVLKLKWTSVEQVCGWDGLGHFLVGCCRCVAGRDGSGQVCGGVGRFGAGVES
ncbi:hypothetical protein E2C01_097269 [Portunus trituberculatus]|uniref:Uncharacterized protein n=1 Tax=Portunus trituberculatus TaxID=210409 RepID=A0A5B7K9I7_PORTR|nr:hypothetical protein [Portunus trituberculatus]